MLVPLICRVVLYGDSSVCVHVCGVVHTRMSKEV